MKIVLVAIAVVLIAVILGWVSVNRSPGKTEINIETGKIERDAEHVIQKGEAVLENATQKGKTLLKK
ncbi:MAG: hypothetical protein JWM11_2463 [Planctomycetaceae bacterium]|nr:hypothetical protein [Planctomycetaceae bacterium]